MNIIDTLIRLRDDLKEWVTNNIIALNEKFATKSELNDLENRIEALETIIENGEYIPPIEPGDPVNLLDIGELYLNERYSKSGGGLTSENGAFALFVPIETGGIGGTTTHTLKFKNLRRSITADTASTLYLLDSNKANPTIVNGSANFKSMTSGVTISDDETSAQVTFTATATTKYLVISVTVVGVSHGTVITEDDISDYIITLD